MPIVIKKRVTLEFLGEQYKDDYLEFKAIPLKDYEPMMKELDGIKDDDVKATAYIVKKLNEQFIGGKFDGSEVKVEDLGDIDSLTAVKCFRAISGDLDPKGQGQSPTPSGTEDQPPLS